MTTNKLKKVEFHLYSVIIMAIILILIYLILQKQWTLVVYPLQASHKNNSQSYLKMGRSISNISIVSCRHLIPSSSLPIWKQSNHSWYTIINSTKFLEKRKYKYGIIRLVKEHIMFFQQHKEGSYRRFGTFLNSNDTAHIWQWMELNGNLAYQNKIAMFTNVIIYSDGYIVHRLHCLSVRNGGCYSPNTHGYSVSKVNNHAQIISIAGYWSEGYWHFTMESLTGLFHLSADVVQSSVIHVSTMSKWVIDWLHLLEINSEFIITGTVSADIAIIPELGRCGAPSVDQIYWLREKVLAKIPSKAQRNIIYIERHYKRVLKNSKEISRSIRAFALQNNYVVKVHDDRTLPGLEMQLRQFATAAIVIGPHGAGMVNLIAAAKNTCVIEFVPVNLNHCYARLSFLLGNKYFSVLIQNSKVDVRSILQVLMSC